TLETAVAFVDFLKNTDSRSISNLEVLTLLALSRDAIEGYIPLKKSERGSGGYYEELKRSIYDGLEENKAVYQSVWKISGMLSQQKERAVKKALMLNQWISSRETKEIEEGYEVFSGAIKRVGEDFSWLAETLASLAKEVGWDTRGINRITTLSQRLIYGVTEKGVALSRIRIRGLVRTYINRLLVQGYDTPEAIADLLLDELERHLPKHLAERLYHHFHRQYEKKAETVEKEKPPEPPEIRDALPITSAAPAKNQKEVPLPIARDNTFPKSLADILPDETLLAALRARLADAKDLRELITDPPVIFMDERQQLFFYQGVPIKLQPACFNYLLILAERTKQIVARDEIYRCLWPGSMNYDGSNKPYERQISDHKRRCIAQIKKGVSGRITIETGELETLIFTRSKVGYMLNLPKENVFIFS
ncbi:MAG: hypothetical protein Q8K46_00495, partial [Deltaproteobacteria bacterium]|nr:hypothetical protein [Deltaproteobacteria bacterium]